MNDPKILKSSMNFIGRIDINDALINDEKDENGKDIVKFKFLDKNIYDKINDGDIFIYNENMYRAMDRSFYMIATDIDLKQSKFELMYKYMEHLLSGLTFQEICKKVVDDFIGEEYINSLYDYGLLDEYKDDVNEDK